MSSSISYLRVKTKIDRRGLTKDCHACMRGVASSSTLQKKTSTGAVRKDDDYCAIFLRQLSLLISSPTGFLLPEMWLLRGASRGPRKNFLGSLSLAIFTGPLINYAIILPLLLTDLKIRLSALSSLLMLTVTLWGERAPDEYRCVEN